MRKQVLTILIAIMASAMILQMSSCVKQDFDSPPVGTVPVGKVLTIGEVRQMYADSGSYTFTGDYSVYGTVVMGESTGNIYRSAYIQDTSGAINLYMQSSGDLQSGDDIRVYLKGCEISQYGDLLQIANVQNDSNIIIVGNANFIQPREVTIAELNNAMESGNFSEYESQLIWIDSVQFTLGDLGKNYADAEDYGERFIEDCNFNTLMVRTSDYASFADDPLPEGRGPLVVIAGRYYDNIQLIIRTTYEVQLYGPRCGTGGGGVTSIDENFDDQENNIDIAVEGWINVASVGSRRWQGKEFDANFYAQATAFNSGEENETWLITRAIDLDAMTQPMASFETAQAYWEHDGLEILFSTDFNGANIAGATWTALPCTIAGENDPYHDWIPSGDIDLSGYSGTGYIAFKYAGSDLNGNTTSYRVDNVKVWDAGK